MGITFNHAWPYDSSPMYGRPYAQTLILMKIHILVMLFSFWVITFHPARITTYHFDKALPLSPPSLSIPIRSRNEGNGP